MVNKVGDTAPTPEAIAAIRGRLQAAIDEIRAFGLLLSAPERKRLSRAREGGDPHVDRVIELAQKHGVSLRNYPLPGIQADLALAQALEPIANDLEAGLQLVHDTMMQARSEAWEGFLAHYGVLQNQAARDPGVETELRPVLEFMSQGRRKRAPQAPQA